MAQFESSVLYVHIDISKEFKIKEKANKITCEICSEILILRAGLVFLSIDAIFIKKSKVVSLRVHKIKKNISEYLKGKTYSLIYFVSNNY